MVRLFIDAFSDYANFKWLEKLRNPCENKQHVEASRLNRVPVDWAHAVVEVVAR